MAKPKELSGTAALVSHGVYQYVRLPKEFRFEGEQVEIRKYQNGVVLKPLADNGFSKRHKKAKH